MSEAPIIEAKGLHTYYGSSHILHGIDFTVRAGETISLLGRNGMGKTTTLRSILGLTKPKRGAVRINGRDMTGAEPYRIAREGIAFVPEGRGIFHNLTVREHLLMAASPGPDGRTDWTFERIMALFPRLSERLDHHGNRLSGGEQQMLTIGRALMTNPRLLILDEATEGLAPLIRHEIWGVIRLLKHSGLASVIVDKNVTTLLELADRNVIMVKGKVAFDGSSAELAANPQILAAHLGV
ncbi:MAG TPA: ABC transporter ATP-binding protein [Alphaproteobacteria bacterium]|nr:ABC transporter ATP-binding protein [Alphaproteobacteria bacterium]